MKRLIALSLALLMGLFLLTGCTQPQPEAPDSTPAPQPATPAPEETPQEPSLGYEQITQEEAKAIMDRGEADVILDVRTPDEYEDGHIRGAVLLPDYEIREKAESVLPDKDAVILVYCRTGRRSKEASAALAELGYTNVKEFGGITTWTYENVTLPACGGA